MNKIQAFAKKKFGITLTAYQIDYIKYWVSGTPSVYCAVTRRAGRITAQMVIKAYVADGLKQGE